ncbi:MAG TPA: PKD domain-containing protein [Anaeromyxobacteraceae bacterium]|nr:PKD domain-containing protein [Anaeromyxobacteraceae bacterium]
MTTDRGGPAAPAFGAPATRTGALIAAALLAACGGGAAPTYIISGRVSGVASAGVMVALSGDAAATTRTDGAGSYAFTGLKNGTYVVSPALAGYVFRPSSLRITVSGNGVIGQNFAELPGPPAIAAVTATPSTLYVGQVAAFSARASSPAGLALSDSWDFGDGTPAATGTTATHSFASAGTYAVTVTVSDSNGLSSQATTPATVLQPSTPPAEDNALVPYCSGALCAAADASTYAGNGVGIWRYNNATSSTATIDVSVGGVTSADSVTLLFSNGLASPAATIPSAGLGPRGLRVLRPSGPEVLASEADPHTALVLRNLGNARRVVAERGRAPSARAAPALPQPTPAVGTSRTWYDNNGVPSPVAYTATVHYTCLLPTGRSAVFWLDPNVIAAGAVTETMLSQLEGSFCGQAGGYAQLTALLGDVWGPAASSFNDLIQDGTGAPLDVNVVILQVPAGTPWGGYFDSSNNFLATSVATSNQALAFFINGSNLASNVRYYISTLLHESTHMINFYQRAVVRATVHDTWLEETSAMMTEDIVVPAVDSGYDSDTFVRVPTYLQSGGGVSYVNWPTLASASYGLGGGFGAFLNRRYGLAVYQGLVSSCNDGPNGVTSYACLDALIAQQGGTGFADDFARYGASVFGLLPAVGIPWGFGFPETSAGRYVLGAIDVSVMVATRPAVAAALPGGFTATTQTYVVDTVAAGQTKYARSGVEVPAQTTLLVVVEPTPVAPTCASAPAGSCASTGEVYCGSSVCCSATFPYYCPGSNLCYANPTGAALACGTECVACVTPLQVSCTVAPAGTCGATGEVYCGNRACCQAAYPFYCASTNLCYASQAGAANACGASCSACR